MLQNLLTSHFRRFLVQSSPWLIAAVIGLILAISSAYSAYNVWTHQPLMLVPENPLVQKETFDSGGDAKTHMAEISGAVKKPGIYAVSDGSRWQEVVLMANGFLESADRQYIHQKLNLAEKVKDQAKLYIPFASESARVQSSSVTAEISKPSNLFVNTATKEMWDEIEGIGEIRAANILAGVPYKDKNDFLERSGVSPSLYKNIEQRYAEIIY